MTGIYNQSQFIFLTFDGFLIALYDKKRISSEKLPILRVETCLLLLLLFNLFLNQVSGETKIFLHLNAELFWSLMYSYFIILDHSIVMLLSTYWR